MFRNTWTTRLMKDHNMETHSLIYHLPKQFRVKCVSGQWPGGKTKQSKTKTRKKTGGPPLCILGLKSNASHLKEAVHWEPKRCSLHILSCGWLMRFPQQSNATVLIPFLQESRIMCCRSPEPDCICHLPSTLTCSSVFLIIHITMSFVVTTDGNNRKLNQKAK